MGSPGMKATLNDVAQALSGILIGNDVMFDGVSIDTRTLMPGNLYVAIKGQQFDGHRFVPQAQVQGASAVLVEEAMDTTLPQIIVPDTRLALAELAGAWRNRLSLQVAGVTGSNGKTTVKEMIAAIFATQGPTLYTRGNLNNDIGVPLTLLKLTPEHRYAVIEMGANHPGEIAYSSRYARADVSVINNVGPAHIEGFGSLEGVARAKGEIIQSLALDGTAVLNRDDAFHALWLTLAESRHVVSFGFSDDATVRASGISSQLAHGRFETRFELVTGQQTISIELALAGLHNVKNALAAAAVALQFDIDLQSIKQGLESLKPVTGRMQPLRGRLGNTIIDDTYNANPASLRAALESLDGHPHEIWVVLGAFGELGAESLAIHRQMGELIRDKQITRLFATGADAAATVSAFGSGGEYFERQDQLIQALNQALSGQETLLIKGSRAQKMENVVAALVDNFRAA